MEGSRIESQKVIPNCDSEPSNSQDDEENHETVRQLSQPKDESDMLDRDHTDCLSSDSDHRITALVADDGDCGDGDGGGNNNSGSQNSNELSLQQSNEAYHIKKPVILVPRAERRGLLSTLCLIEEITDSRDLSNGAKAYIVFLVSIAAMVAPMGGSIFLPALTNVAATLHSTADIINVSYGLYVLSLGIFPLWWSSLSEYYGRRTVYVLSFFLFAVFQIGCALSKNIGSLMIFRILSGGAAASVQAVGAGTLGDIYSVTERGRAMGYFYLGPLMGPLMAPIIGGALTIKWNWRSTQWFMMIFGAITFLLIVLGLPETLARKCPIPGSSSSNSSPDTADKTADVIDPDNGEYNLQDQDDGQLVDTLGPTQSRRSSRSFAIPADLEAEIQSIDNRRRIPQGVNQMSNSLPLPKQPYDFHRFIEKLHHHKHEGVPSDNVKSHNSRIIAYKRIFIAPLRSFRLLRYPPLPLTICFSAYCFFSLYFLNIGIQELYSSPPYSYSSLLVGLTYLPNSVGYVISSIGNGYWSDHIIANSIQKHGKIVPEDRLGMNVYIAIVLFPISLLIFGWTAHAEIFWVVPLVGTFLFGIASMVIFGNTMTYLVDVLPGKGATGVALNNLFRMVLAAIATFVASPLKDAIGYGWLYTILAIGTTFSWFCLYIIKKRGPIWREIYNVKDFY